jgi:hypothetical protein
MTVWGFSVSDGVGMGWKKDYLIVFGCGLGNRDFLKRIVDFSWLAIDFLDCNGGWHGCRELEARSRCAEEAMSYELGKWDETIRVICSLLPKK